MELLESSVRTPGSEQSLTMAVASFDVSENISLVPVFRESEVVAFFAALRGFTC